jgi:hypothetical protein
MNKKMFFTLAVLVLVALACTFTPVTTVATPTTQPPAVNTPTTQPPAGGGGNGQRILFQDDFSDVNSGWDRSSTDNGTTDYANSGYEIHITATNLSKWANPSQDFQNDVRIEVDATKLGGPDDNAFGVMCRYQDTNNYYKLYITSDGYAGVIQEENGNSTVISSADGKMPPVNGINQGMATNHIRVDCIGDTLTLYANGTQVAIATDSSFTGGDVGLVAALYDTSGTDILFQNFFVYKP